MVRLIHTCGQPDVTDHIAFTEDVVARSRAALLAGAPVLCDRRWWPRVSPQHGCPRAMRWCRWSADPRAPQSAARIGNTRSAAGVELWADRLGGSVVAIGNAPTALFHLLELLDHGVAAPAAVLGGPVGFVGSAQSKQELIDDPRGMSYLVVTGRRGGSAIAAAAVNAIASDRE